MRIKVKTQILICATLLLTDHWAQGQTTRSWTGAAGDFKLATANNWSPSGSPAGGSSDILQWDATAATGNLLVTNASALDTSPGLNINITAAHTGSLAIIGSGGNRLRLNTNSLTIANGVGAVSFGANLATAFPLALAGAGNGAVHAWTNDSSSAATVNGDCYFLMGGGGGHTLALAGAGNWNLYASLVAQNSGAGLALRVAGTGTVLYAPTNAPATTYSGTFNGTTLNSGTLKLGNASAAANILGGALTLSGGTLDINGFSFTNSLNGGANIDTSLVGGTPVLTVSNAAATTYNGSVKNTQGILSLTKLGVGALTLGGANTYGGSTLVLAGSLNVNGSIGAGAVTVTNGATLGGTGTIGGAVTLQPGASAIFSVTNNGGVNGTPMTVSGSLTLNTNVVTIFVPGSTPLALGTYTLVNAAGGISGGFATNLTSFSFTGAGVAPGTSSSVSNGANSAVLIVAPAGITSVWTNDLVGGSGIWTVAPNWDSNPNVPTNKGDVAILGVGSAVSTVTVNVDMAVGGLTFTNPASFILADAGKTMSWDSKGSGATMSVNAGTSNVIATAISLNDKVNVNVAGGTTLAMSGAISGTSGANTLTKSGNGTLVLAGANTYGPAAGSIGTILSGGTLELTNSQALGLGDLTNAANATLLADKSMTVSNKVRINSTSTLTVNDGGNTLLLAGGFTAAGSLAKTGSGLVLFTNLGTSTIGGFGADNGVLEIGAGMTLNGTANGGNTYLNSNATLIVDAGAVVNVSASSAFYGIGSVAGQSATNIINGTFNWPLNVANARTGGGVIIINGGLFSCNQFFNGQNATDSGIVQLNGGTLLVTNVVTTSTFGGGNPFYFNGGTLAAKGNNDGGPFWPLNANIFAYASTNAGTISNSGFNITIAQPINSDPAVGGTDGGLIFKGSGVTTLSGVNSYSGPTVVNAGRLMVSGSIGAGAVTVNNGAAVGGTGVIGGNINWQTGSSAYFVVTNNGGANSTPLAVSGNVTLNNSNAVTINVAGSTPLPLGTYILMNAATITGAFTNTPTFTGAGAAAGTVGTISISGGQAILTVAIGGNTWAVDVDGTWSTAADWSLNPVIPRAAGDAAVLGVGTAFRTVTLNTNVTLTAVAFTNDNSFLVANGGATMTFTNGPTGSGMAINLTGGVSGGTSNAIAAPVTILSTNALNVSGGLGSKLALSGSVSGTGGFIMSGDGTATLTLTGSNSYAAGTTISAGTVVLGSTNAIGTGKLTLNGGGIDSGVASLVNANNNLQTWSGSNTFLGSFDLNLGTGAVVVTNTPILTVASNRLTVNGIINGGTQTITLAGNGTLELGNVNTFGTVNSGVATLAFGNDFAAGSASTILNAYSTTAAFASSSSAARTIHNILGTGNGAQGWNFTGAGNLTFDGGVTSYNFNKTVTVSNPVTTWNFALPSGAAATFKNGPGTFVLAGANANLGGNTVNAGTLALANTSALGAGPLTMNGGNLDSLVVNLVNLNNNSNIWNTNFTFVGSQSLNLGTGGTVLASSNVVITVSSNILTVGGVIDDGALGYGMTVAGAGKLVLNGANTYLGSTIVSNGTLGGTGSLSGPVQILAAGVLSPGASIGTLTVSNDLNLAGNVLVEVNTSVSPSNDLVVVTGGLTNLGVGTVVVSNQGPVLVAGNSFHLFSKPVVNGNLLNITTNGLTGGLVWTNKLAIDGSIAVVAPTTVATNPTNLTSSVSGTTLNLSWPADHLGWILQTQTNSRSIGLKPQTNQWFDVTGSSSVTNTSVTLDKEQPTVFFRLRSP